MIVFDLETTGLPKAEGSDLDMQPRIIEFGAIKVDDNLEEVDRLEFFCNPGHELDPQIRAPVHGSVEGCAGRSALVRQERQTHPSRETNAAVLQAP